jgi:hypothetical protein
MTTHFGHGRNVRYWCTDESRWGLKTLTGRVITLRGVKPMVQVQWPRDAFWLYGAEELFDYRPTRGGPIHPNQ